MILFKVMVKRFLEQIQFLIMELLWKYQMSTQTVSLSTHKMQNGRREWSYLIPNLMKLKPSVAQEKVTMASRHFSDDKLEKKETIRKVSQYVVDIYDGRFCVKFDSDDGGTVLNVYLETEEPSQPLGGLLQDAFKHSKWHGWRYVVTKVPLGYIDAILEAPEPKDY